MRINLLVDYFGEFVPPTKLQNCSVGARGGIELYIRDMENRILGHVRWRREEKLEDYVTLEQVVRAIHIWLDNLSSKIVTNMELLIEQKKKKRWIED